jgi:hypothetical protein
MKRIHIGGSKRFNENLCDYEEKFLISAAVEAVA